MNKSELLDRIAQLELDNATLRNKIKEYEDYCARLKEHYQSHEYQASIPYAGII